MKKLILGGLIGMSLATILAFTVAKYDPKKSTAEVEQFQGLYVFVDANPVMEYEYLGTVKSSFSLGDEQYTGVRDRLIKKCKKDYPLANGLILTFKTGGADKADAIKFKEEK